MTTAETLALAGLRMIASPVMKKLVDKAFSYVGMDVPSDLKDLVDRVLPQLAIATRVSEETCIHMAELVPWLRKLKDTYDEAEDILDEVEYQTIAKKIKHEKRAFVVSVTTQIAESSGKKLSFLSSKKRNLWSRLNKLKNDVKGLVEVAKDLYGVQGVQPNETFVEETSWVPKDTLFVGRNAEHKNIVEELLKESVPSERKSYPVVAIVGIGGAGKTTLAQHIYHDHHVKNHFDIRMWISLTRKMDVIKHTKAMIESASLEKVCTQSSTLTALHSELVEILSRSKRALIVLDDLWYDKSEEEDIRCKRNEDENWGSLLAPLNFTNGSKVILVTSRSKKLPQVLESETVGFLRIAMRKYFYYF